MINICSVYWKQNLISNSILLLSIYQVKKYVLPSPIILNWPNFSLHRPYVGYYNNWLLVEQRCDHWVTKLAWLLFCNPQRISWQRNIISKSIFFIKYLWTHCSMSVCLFVDNIVTIYTSYYYPNLNLYFNLNICLSFHLSHFFFSSPY